MIKIISPIINERIPHRMYFPVVMASKNNEIRIVNPISSELGVLRNSIFPNLVFYLKKNIDRGFKDLSFFQFDLPACHASYNSGTIKII